MINIQELRFTVDKEEISIYVTTEELAIEFSKSVLERLDDPKKIVSVERFKVKVISTMQDVRNMISKIYAHDNS